MRATSRRRHGLHLDPVDLRAGLLRRLLRRLVGHAGAAHAADGVTNAISSVIIVGALIAAAAAGSATLEVARPDRGGAGQRQHLRRLRGHRADARDVQEEGAQGWLKSAHAQPAGSCSPIWSPASASSSRCAGCRAPRRSQRGNRFGMIGMAIAVADDARRRTQHRVVSPEIVGGDSVDRRRRSASSPRARSR